MAEKLTELVSLKTCSSLELIILNNKAATSVASV